MQEFDQKALQDFVITFSLECKPKISESALLVDSYIEYVKKLKPVRIFVDEETGETVSISSDLKIIEYVPLEEHFYKYAFFKTILVKIFPNLHEKEIEEKFPEHLFNCKIPV